MIKSVPLLPRKPVMIALLGAATALGGYAVGTATAQREAATVTPIFSRALEDRPGTNLSAVVVDYAPGGGSKAHHHHDSASIFAYVVAGAVRSQVNDGEARVYQAGEFFFEPPGASHKISENASDSEPARLLAVIVADEGAVITRFDD